MWVFLALGFRSFGIQGIPRRKAIIKLLTHKEHREREREFHRRAMLVAQIPAFNGN